ncbi:hypothetical protein JXM67_00635 [candidate division WOR-3 bacterium]|nr:hypothetical protein [candidate division WOR-3 bacterium]
MKKVFIPIALVAIVLIALTGCNNVPEINTVAANPNTVAPGDTATISCTAVDADNDVLVYSWQSVDQADSVFTGKSFPWIAPAVTGDYRFYLVLSDERGGYAYDSSLMVTVRANLLDPDEQDIGTRQAIITWNAADDGDWVAYEIYRANSPNPHLMIAKITSSRLDTVYKDMDVFPNTEYYYVVATVTPTEERSYSNEISFFTDNFAILFGQSLGGAQGVRLSAVGNYIFCAARAAGVRGFGIGSSTLTPGAIIAPQVAGDWAYDVSVGGGGLILGTAFGTGGMETDSIQNPLSPVYLASTPLSLATEATAVCLDGLNAFVGGTDPSAGIHSLEWYDITNPASPALQTTLQVPDVPTDIYVDGSYIYVTMGDGGLAILQATATPALNLVSTRTTGGYANRVYVSGNFAYLAAGTDGLVILDVSDKANPSPSAQWTDDGGNDAQGIYLLGNIAYLADGAYGLRVLNISNPLAPELKYTLDVGEQIMDVWVRSFGGKFQAIVADWHDAITMIEW